MDHVVRDVPNTFVYVDDIVVYTDTVDEHINILQLLFQKLLNYGLVVNKEKSHFFQHSINYLSYEISPYGYKPLATIVPRLDKIPVPKNKIELLRFLGLVHYYCIPVPFYQKKLLSYMICKKVAIVSTGLTSINSHSRKFVILANKA